MDIITQAALPTAVLQAVCLREAATEECLTGILREECLTEDTEAATEGDRRLDRKANRTEGGTEESVPFCMEKPQ